MRLRRPSGLDATDWLALAIGAVVVAAGLFSVADGAGLVETVTGVPVTTAANALLAGALFLGGVRVWLRDSPRLVAAYVVALVAIGGSLFAGSGPVPAAGAVLGPVVAGVVLLVAGLDVAALRRRSGG